jgi:hypothetical protein
MKEQYNLFKMIAFLFVVAILSVGCASPAKFIQTDDGYTPKPKPKDAPILFRQGPIKRPHKVIGVIEVKIGRRARRPELNKAMIDKAREIGADGVMMVEYDVDHDVYIEHHHAVIGRGLFRRHVVVNEPHTTVTKTASGIAVIFLK